MKRVFAALLALVMCVCTAGAVGEQVVSQDDGSRMRIDLVSVRAALPGTGADVAGDLNVADVARRTCGIKFRDLEIAENDASVGIVGIAGNGGGLFFRAIRLQVVTEQKCALVDGEHHLQGSLGIKVADDQFGI